MVIKKTLVLFFIVFIPSCSAMASSEGSYSKDSKYVEGGFVYEYKKIPKYDDSGKFMYNNGQISVSEKSGKIVSMSRYIHAPGCGTDFPAIKSLKIPWSPSHLFEIFDNTKQTFIVFCGSASGRHKTLRFYNPHFGFVSAIDFFDGPVNLREGEKELILVVWYKEYFDSIENRVRHPVVYSLFSNRLSVFTVISNSEKSKDIYKNYILRWTKWIDSNSTENISGLVALLAMSILADDKEVFCRTSMKLKKNNFQSIQEELANKLGINFTFNCKEK